ncbi:unnamed protein product, partial [Brassica rapa]
MSKSPLLLSSRLISDGIDKVRLFFRSISLFSEIRVG